MEDKQRRGGDNEWRGGGENIGLNRGGGGEIGGEGWVERTRVTI